MTNADEVPPATRRRRLAADIGARVRTERQRLGLTLDELAARGGSSRSMISAIERGDKIPTVLTLDQIASALGVSVSRLLVSETQSRVSLLRVNDQKVLEDPKSQGQGQQPGFRRRVTSPVLENVDFEMGRLEIDPGVDAGSFPPHPGGWSEYVVVERGALELTLDGVSYRLETGDAIYFASDCTHAYKNSSDGICIAFVVTAGPQNPSSRRVGDEQHSPGGSVDSSKSAESTNYA
jgi:XRE family transcriptional regulator, regulator of sulfur utilization